MAELSREKLLKKLDFLKMIYDKSVSPTRRANEEMGQAYSQIRVLIQRKVGRDFINKWNAGYDKRGNATYVMPIKFMKEMLKELGFEMPEGFEVEDA